MKFSKAIVEMRMTKSTLHTNGFYPIGVPDIVWAPLAAALLMLIVGLIGLIAHQPWLFPSLGPTAFLQTGSVDQRAHLSK